MNKDADDVDFDFFDTTRNAESPTPRSPGKYFDRKPPPSPPSSSSKHGERPKSGIHREDVKGDGSGDSKKYLSDSDSYSDSFSSESDSETPRVDKKKRNGDMERERNVDRNNKHEHYSGSSSAYSNSDYSSDDSIGKSNNNNNHKKEIIEVTVPKVSINAWSSEFTKDENEEDKMLELRKSKGNGKRRDSYNQRKHRSHSNSSESDSSCERKSSTGKKPSERVKSAKPNEGRHRHKGRKPLRSTSSSYSNNSDITDVSPLESPQISPRAVRRRYYDNSEKENGQFDDVQYNNSPDTPVDIKLESDKIDLSILMKCMADIDKEKQQRLKTNSRRVMFAPPTINDKGNQNYTFTMGRAKLIERENQRLLKQIMNHVGTGTAKQSTPAKTKKVVHAEPVVPRLTPSAVNRMREQRRIETENMQMLNRLQRVRPTSGMSKHEQIKEFERQASYGIPTGTQIYSGDVTHYETMTRRDMGSSMSTRRSRPSSAKSNTSQTGGRRSRPSSAKSNASVVSNASMRSNMSLRSNVSKRSTVSVRSAGGKGDTRPEWNDRFSYS